MRFSEAWLREWVDPAIDTQTLADQLSMAGLEVESVEPVAGPFSGVVVGRVLSLARHPDAERLRVCQVDVGGGEPLQIICGAANVAADMRVPVALVGAVLPGDLHIQRAKLRGVESFGMICSTAELGLEEKSAGILPLPEDAPIGRDLRGYLGLDDHTIEVDLTPDRGDCLALAGIAREVGVINRVPLTQVEVRPVPAEIDDRCEVRLEAPAACPRYACRIVRGIDPAAQTPLWMKERLRRGGIRAISPVVDVTNYVMLELGQPMHGFDLALIDRHLEVRMARPGEHLVLLDGQEIALRGDTLVIADASGPAAMAGIMGGEHSGVGAQTRDILLESAFFSPIAISGRPRAYGLNTDSSHRFERGVDPELQVRAIERAARLLLDIAGGRPGPVMDVTSPDHLPAPRPIGLRRSRIKRVLGVEIEDGEVEDVLRRLGMRVEPGPGGWSVTAPSARFDIGIEVDLIEEIGRIYGYSRIPTSHAMAGTALVGPMPEARFDLERARDLLVDRGYQEVVTYSFVSPEIQALVDPGASTIALANPLSSELSVMRSSLWPGLLLTARYNQARQQPRVRIFESGLRFRQGLEGLVQEPMLAGLITGDLWPEQWGAPGRGVDFFDAKGDLEALLGLVDPRPVRFEAALHPALHPGQSARALRDDETLGWIGALHPELRRRLDFPADVLLFEVHLAPLTLGRLPAFRPLSKFPSIRRDLALVVDQGVSGGQVIAAVHAVGLEILQDILLFDVYTGDKVDSDRKSLALALILRDSSHTLTDQEVDAVVAAVLRRLEDTVGATLRN
jgi:phenylalanyl-tRNA synthetase beta chain